jgi:glycosyltransferase involved in cell wall biosynthesis
VAGMKIAIVEPEVARHNTSFQAQVGMWEFIAREYGCEVTVFADARLNYRNEQVQVKSVRRIGGRFWFPPYPALLAHLPHYDVIMTSDPSLYTYALWAALAVRVSKGRLILDDSMTLLAPARETMRGRIILRVAKAVYRLAHRIVVASPLAAERLVKLGLVEKASDRIVELGHPVDVNLFSGGSGASKDAEINILSVGQLLYEKGHHLVIEALADLLKSHRGMRLLIAGEGYYHQNLKDICHRYGVVDKVLFLGLVPNKELAKIYLEAHIFVHYPITTDRWEEFFGVAVVEAMSSQLPVVVSDCGALRHVVPEGAGFILPQKDPEALQGKVKLLVESPELRDKMGACGRAYICQRYSVLEVARRCYEKVLS